MTVEEAFAKLLTDDTSVKLLIGDRVFPDQAPAKTPFPRVIYQQSDRKTVMTYSGPVQTNSYTMDLEIQAKRKADAKAVAKAIRRLVVGYSGKPSQVRIQGIFDETESDEHETPQHALERGIFSVNLTLGLWFVDPAETS